MFPDNSVGKESACNAGDLGSISRSGRSTGEGIGYTIQYSWASLVAQLVKNLPAMQETCVRSLGLEEPLEKERLSTPVFWPREFVGLYSPWSRKESDTTQRLSLSLNVIPMEITGFFLFASFKKKKMAKCHQSLVGITQKYPRKHVKMKVSSKGCLVLPHIKTC